MGLRVRWCEFAAQFFGAQFFGAQFFGAQFYGAQFSDRPRLAAAAGTRGALVGAANSDRHLALAEGAAPRHLAWHPSGQWAFVLCELDGYIVTCSWDGAAGRLAPTSKVFSLADGVTPSRAHHSGGAHIAASADGRMVYATTRTDGAVVAFAVDAASGALSRVQAVPCGGVCPRMFLLDGARLLCGNQDSQNIVSFPINDDGTLGDGVATALDGVCPAVIM